MVRVSRLRCLFVFLAIVACGGLLFGQLAGCAPPEPRAEPEIDAVEPDDDSADEPVDEPAEPADEPVDEPADEPAEPADEPAEPADEPAEPMDEPADEPAEPADEPAEPMDEPAEPAEPAGGFDALPLDAPVSSYAPAENLISEVDVYMTRMAEAVSTPDEYADFEARVARDANTMIVLALALGLHDEDHAMKAKAPAILQAAQAVAATDDYESAKAAVEELKTAVAEGGDGPELKWEKVASLEELMEQVPLVHASIRRRVSRRFERNVEGIAGDAATVAAIAQGTLPNIDETIEPDKPEEWEKYSLQMRNAAAELLAAAQAENEEAAKAAFEKLDQSCHDCHVVFHPEEAN